MLDVTRKSIKESEIDIQRIEKRLREIAEKISINNKQNLTDINVICEEIFGQILNRLYDINLVSLSAEVSGNYLAVDLVDYKNRVAYQVTSQYKKEKINNTIEKFNRSDLHKEIDELHFLILNMTPHKYIGQDTVQLENGNEFSFVKDIMNFNGLIDEIKKKNDKASNFVVEVYNIINMVYDSGRLKYSSIVKETELLLRTACYKSDDTRWWHKGYGDVHLSAFIPETYKGQISCMLQIRQYNISGAFITFCQDVLLSDYFVSESEFENKHNVGRYEDEEDLCMQIENMRIMVNAHTAYHIYKLFKELNEEYLISQRYIDNILGVEGLSKVGEKYLLMAVSVSEWKEILFFARNHDWCKQEGEMEWNIFNNNSREDSLMLSPNIYGTMQGDILAKISVAPVMYEDNTLNLYWEPGFKANESCMKYFDNIVKWKADYTKEWVQNKLLGKAHDYYERHNKSVPVRSRIWRMLHK